MKKLRWQAGSRGRSGSGTRYQAYEKERNSQMVSVTEAGVNEALLAARLAHCAGLPRPARIVYYFEWSNVLDFIPFQ